jgi:large subunit ribosomal protein L15
MPLSLHTLTASARRRRRRVGRGEGSGRGKTAGRGTKGQRARTGGRRGVRTRSLKALYQHLPKLGGFRSRRPKATAISLDVLRRHFPAGATVTPALLAQRGLVPPGRAVKVLGTGTLTHALVVRGCRVSASAREKITTAGGTVGEG